MVVSGEAVMTPYTLEQSMTAASKDGSLVDPGESVQEEPVRPDGDEEHQARCRISRASGSA